MNFNFIASETEKNRYLILLNTLSQNKHLFENKKVLDFGASWGTSSIALCELGAKEVIGVELDAKRVEEGNALVRSMNKEDSIRLMHVEDTSKLPFSDNEFSFVIANAVFEHIPQPRDAYLVELWRLVSSGGFLMINETPNAFFPKEVHTTNLWCNHWLPKHIAYKRALARGRFDPERLDWDSSGWRGVTYFEIIKALKNYCLIPEKSRIRHRVFSALGIPASILDPYPTWVFKKI